MTVVRSAGSRSSRRNSRDLTSFIAEEGPQPLPSDHSRSIFDAAEFGDVETMEIYIKAGHPLNVRAPNQFSWTPLIVAVKYGHASVAKLLIDAGADMRARDSSGRTALDWAFRKRGSREIMRLFAVAELLGNEIYESVQEGAAGDIDAILSKTSDRIATLSSALQLAVRKRDVKALQVLENEASGESSLQALKCLSHLSGEEYDVCLLKLRTMAMKEGLDRIEKKISLNVLCPDNNTVKISVPPNAYVAVCLFEACAQYENEKQLQHFDTHQITFAETPMNTLCTLDFYGVKEDANLNLRPLESSACKQMQYVDDFVSTKLGLRYAVDADTLESAIAKAQNMNGLETDVDSAKVRLVHVKVMKKDSQMAGSCFCAVM